MPNLRLVILLILAFLLTAAITHLQAQQYGPEPEGMCPEPTTDYGAAMGFFISAGATPGGESRKLANKTCYNQDLELSDQKTYSSSSPASNATTTYSYDVGRGRLKPQVIRPQFLYLEVHIMQTEEVAAMCTHGFSGLIHSPFTPQPRSPRLR